MCSAIVRQSDTLRSILPPNVAAYEVYGAAPEQWLLPDERADVEKAVDKRRREFAGGRCCARAALESMGHVAGPIRRRADRLPDWPAGVLGSITHTDGFCGAAMARVEHYAGIGIDAEQQGRVQPRLERQILTDSEQAWLLDQPPASRETLATVFFSAKEAFYKCQFCVTAGWLGFHDVDVALSDQRFSVRLRGPVAGLGVEGNAWDGRFVVSDSHVFTAMAMTNVETATPEGPPLNRSPHLGGNHVSDARAGAGEVPALVLRGVQG